MFIFIYNLGFTWNTRYIAFLLNNEIINTYYQNILITILLKYKSKPFFFGAAVSMSSSSCPAPKLMFYTLRSVTLTESKKKKLQ